MEYSGHTVGKKTDGQKKYDKVVNGLEAEIKGSTESRKKQSFQFNQVRKGDDSSIYCTGFLYPQSITVLEIPKSLIVAGCNLALRNHDEKLRGKKKIPTPFSYQHGNDTFTLSASSPESLIEALSRLGTDTVSYIVNQLSYNV